MWAKVVEDGIQGETGADSKPGVEEKMHVMEQHKVT